MATPETPQKLDPEEAQRRAELAEAAVKGSLCAYVELERSYALDSPLPADTETGDGYN
jgi:hypothetical protein